MPPESGAICHRLSDWREAVLLADSLLAWEKSVYPLVIMGMVSFVFLGIWIWNPSILTLISVLGLIFVMMDYLVPRVLVQVFNADSSWTGAKEKRFEIICNELDSFIRGVKGSYQIIRDAKKSRPFLHFTGTVVCLLTVAAVGNAVDNLLLAYFWTVFLSLLPGLHRRGLIKKNISGIIFRLVKFFKKEKDAIKKAE